MQVLYTVHVNCTTESCEGVRRGRPHAADRNDVLIQVPVKFWIKLKPAFP